MKCLAADYEAAKRLLDPLVSLRARKHELLAKGCNEGAEKCCKEQRKVINRQRTSNAKKEGSYLEQLNSHSVLKCNDYSMPEEHCNAEAEYAKNESNEVKARGGERNMESR